MSVLIQEHGKKRKLDTDGVPNTKKMERTGKDTFVVHADGGNHFEGKITEPSRVRFKPSGKIFFTSVGICIRKCSNRDTKCDACHNFSELREEVNASS